MERTTNAVLVHSKRRNPTFRRFTQFDASCGQVVKTELLDRHLDFEHCCSKQVSVLGAGGIWKQVRVALVLDYLTFVHQRLIDLASPPAPVIPNLQVTSQPQI